MSTERKATVTYKTTGNQRAFLFPFDYLRKSFIKAKIEGKELAYGTDYTVTGNQISFTAALPQGEHLRIYRETTTKRLVAWEDASILKAADLTLIEVQVLHLVEEAWDIMLEACLLYDETDNTWNALERRIKNTADPVHPKDALNKQYFESESAGFYQKIERILDEMRGAKVSAESMMQKTTALVSTVTATLNPVMLSKNEPVKYDEHTVWFKSTE